MTDNIDLEYSVLGCAIQDATCVEKVCALPEDAFSTANTQALHRAIKRLRANG